MLNSVSTDHLMSKVQPFGPYFSARTFLSNGALTYSDLNLTWICFKKELTSPTTFMEDYGLKVRKVLFINGSMDPWHVAGVTHDLNPESKALLINGTAHCADMYPESDD